MGLARRDRGARRRRCGTSPTTSNEEVARNPHAPFGFRRRAGICCVTPSSDIPDILGRRALHLPARRSERDPCYYSDRLLSRGGAVQEVDGLRDIPHVDSEAQTPHTLSKRRSRPLPAVEALPDQLVDGLAHPDAAPAPELLHRLQHVAFEDHGRSHASMVAPQCLHQCIEMRQRDTAGPRRWRAGAAGPASRTASSSRCSLRSTTCCRASRGSGFGIRLRPAGSRPAPVRLATRRSAKGI